MKLARIGLATALVSGAFVISAPAASATCNPDKPSTCPPAKCTPDPYVDLSTLTVRLVRCDRP